MLDSETKRRIDSCRDILVGKVPDPKSQVEQITIALIYKFMDDMDTQAESFGGHRTFFSGEFAKYAWSQLLAPGVGGHQTIGLYSEAIARMNENPGIPTLFRDIFKNAYLPYRDPETLRAFLKEINTFSYDHSERLGDAFEYLLSVLGSQGDAGQFRTPRHIIDFIVRIVNPTASDRVLDPACGTAGFLISAYKHILEQNKSTRAGDKLTPDQRKRLVENFHGYDISPDMVRLSLANMYLHGFTQPKIYEYDTLTSEERWNETADVILANPPFMSPKGGIRPHRRFSVQATRSEVLFVDYIAEHLSPTGRAGVIVPEGIIFQSQTAYKKLRKILVEKYLVAVISLPSGVFQPYSGVKTSILVFDRALARRSNHIAFFKVENDGYGLGAQRREMDKNDLPDILVAMREYVNLGGDMGLLDSDAQEIQSDSSSSLLKSLIESGRALMVPKEKIAANGDYNLSGERYRENSVSQNKFPHMLLSDICDINPETCVPSEIYPNSSFNYIDISCIENESGKFLGANLVNSEEAPSRARRKVLSGDVLISTVRPNLKAFALLQTLPEKAIASTGFAILRSKPDRILPGYLINILRHDKSVDQMVNMSGKGAYPSINQSDVEKIEIPLPPLELQKEIVAEIEGYQKVIDGARAVLENYRPHITIDPEWPIEILDDHVKLMSGGTPDKTNELYWNGQIPWVSAKDLKKDMIYDSIDHISSLAVSQSSTNIVPAGSLLVLVRGMGLANGVPICELGRDSAFNQDIKAIISKTDLDLKFLKNVLKQESKQFDKILETAAHGTLKLRTEDILAIKIPLPTVETQRAIVAEIEAEQALVNANRELITRMEQKIQKTLARIWGESE